MAESALRGKEKSHRPPFGVVLTRAEERAQKTIERLSELSIPAFSVPLSAPQLTGTPLPREVCDPQTACDVVFTSPTAIAMATKYLENALAGQDLKIALARKQAWCVGKKTASLAKTAGFGQVFSADGALEDLAHLLDESDRFKGRKLHYLAPVHRAGELSRFIKRNDIEVLTTAFYENRLIRDDDAKLAEALEKFENPAIFIYSKRTGEHFFREIERIGLTQRLTGSSFICISKNAARSVPVNLQGRLEVSKLPEEEFMIEIALRQMQTWQRS